MSTVSLAKTGDDVTACNCTEDYGPCEAHSEVLAQREGASLRTADQLLVTFVYDCLAIDPECLSPNGREALRLAEDALDRDPIMGGWLEDGAAGSAEDVREALADLARQLEGYFADLWITWEDGFVIARVIGGPLA